LSFNARHKNGSEVRVYPLTGILKFGFCGQNLRGSSNAYHRDYVDSSIVDRGQDCQQTNIRSDRIEKCIYTFLLRVIDDDESFMSLEALQSQLKDAEARFERAKELYLTGMINHETYEVERYRLEIVKESLQNEHLSATIASGNYLRTQINNWAALLPIEKKRLLGLALKAAWVREHVFVAFQPSIALLPLLRGEKSCDCGKGGHSFLISSMALCERLVIVPPSTPQKEALSLIRYVLDGVGKLEG